jgi:hypothetical protein
VTADAPECDYSLFCVWVPFWSAMTGGYRWSLKSVHGRCPEHRELSKNWRVRVQIGPSAS